jgi:hypothetical protein
MIVAKTIDAAREKALLKEWFDTVQWDEESEGIPPLEDEVDDEGRHANHNQLTHGGGTGLAESSVDISNRKADDLASRVKTPDGGFTVDPRTGKDIKEGYAVAIYPDRSREIPATAVNRKVIQDYAKSNQDLLSQQGNMMGGWHDPDSGNVWLDVSRVTSDRMEAIDLAKQHNQIAMFDLGTGNSVNTGGTGRSSYPFLFGQESNRHLPGKHDQSKHGFKKGTPKGPPTPAPPNDQSKWALQQDKNLNEGQVFTLGYNTSDVDSPVPSPLVSIAKRQGFDAKPTKGSVDDVIANGGTEIHRGLVPHKASGKSAEDLEGEFKNGEYGPGKGNFGNGYYFTTSPGVAKMYAGAPVADKGYNAKPVSGGRVVRAALKPDAKIAHYEDIQKQQKQWFKDKSKNVQHDTHSIGYIVPKDKTSPVVMDGVRDPGHFAALMGYDAIRVPLKDRPQDRMNRWRIRKKTGSDDIGDEIVVLNRGALVVDG